MNSKDENEHKITGKDIENAKKARRTKGYTHKKLANDQQLKNEGLKVNFKKMLGEGAKGKVYTGSRPKAQGKSGPCVVKVMNKRELRRQGSIIKEQDVINEAALFGQQYNTVCNVIETPNNFYIFLPLIPHEKVLDEECVLKKTDLSFFERISLIRDIVITLSLMHHTTLRKDALIHKDIKPENLLIHETTDKDGKRQFMPYIIDFGEAEIADLVDPEHLKDSSLAGSPSHIPQEATVDNKRSTKSDLYSITPMLMGVLGATFPLRKKDEAMDDYCDENRMATAYEIAKAASKVGYDSTGMLNSNIRPDYLSNKVKGYIENFQQRMEEVHDIRIKDNELTEFFVNTLPQYVQIHETGTAAVAEYQPYLIAYEKKLELLATGKWDPKTSPAEIEKIRDALIENQMKNRLAKINQILTNQTLRQEELIDIATYHDEGKIILSLLDYILGQEKQDANTNVKMSAATKMIKLLWDKCNKTNQYSNVKFTDTELKAIHNGIEGLESSPAILEVMYERLFKEPANGRLDKLKLVLNKKYLAYDDLVKLHELNDNAKETILNLLDYTINREEQQQTRKQDKLAISNYNSNWAYFFKGKEASAEVKISAATKMIQHLWDESNSTNLYSDIKFTDAELDAFHDGRLNQFRKDMETDVIIPSTFEDQDRERTWKSSADIRSSR